MKMLNFAKDTQCHKLRWQVAKWNTSAIKFYKNMGATIDDTEQYCDLFF